MTRRKSVSYKLVLPFMKRVISFHTLLKRSGVLAAVSRLRTKVAAPGGGSRRPLAASRVRRRRGASPWRPRLSRRRQLHGGPILALLEALALMLKETAALPAECRARSGGRPEVPGNGGGPPGFHGPIFLCSLAQMGNSSFLCNHTNFRMKVCTHSF